MIIRPLVSRKIFIRGENQINTIIKKRIEDKVGIALFFCEVANVSLEFKSITIDGQYLLKPRTWKLVTPTSIDLNEPVAGIFIYNAKKVKVQDCFIQNFHGNGVSSFQTKEFVVKNTTVKNVSGSGVLGHHVENMTVLKNNLFNCGLLTEKFVVEGKEHDIVQNELQTSFGDGISAYCRNGLIRDNVIENPGRCGIVHDLANDLGYFDSQVVILKNKLTFSSGYICNSNPPAGIWVEQTTTAIVIGNSIEIKKSKS